VSIITGSNVLDLCVSPDGRRVTGVTVVVRNGAAAGPNGPLETLSADLVVDATGRRSRLPDWLDRLGYERPAETRIGAHLAYATRICRRPAGDHGWKAILIQPQSPATSRMGILFPIEGDRWIVTVSRAPVTIVRRPMTPVSRRSPRRYVARPSTTPSATPNR